MCRAHTVLAYAISVSTASLLYAADALPSLEPTLPFFDLVSLRIREGRLEAHHGETNSAVQRVPIEVFEMIREELVLLELEQSRAVLVEQLLCDDCHLLHHSLISSLRWQDLPVEDCDFCHDRLASFEGIRDGSRLKVRCPSFR
jgi:hypothetical protein